MCNILLVDDDPDDTTVLADAIEELYAEVAIFSAQNGETALQMLDKQSALHSNISLVVLDLNMPKMNGTETLMNLRKDQRFSNIPVVIYSTSINSLEKEKCLLLGAHSYITKPLSYKECIETATFLIHLCKSNFFA